MGEHTTCKTNLVEVRDLCVRLGGRKILEGASIDVAKGEILGIVGGSGSGKSVFMRAIIGLVPKVSGKIVLFNRDVDQLDDSESRALELNYSVMFQRGAMFSSLTVLENVQFQMREILDLPTKLQLEMAHLKLEMVGLSKTDSNKYPSQLSGGMIKRAALARALALDPQLMFLDEPTSGLDPISAGNFDELIKSLQQTLGLTVFFITHDLESLYAIADRIGVVADKKIAAVGKFADMIKNTHPWIHSYFMGKRGQALAARFS